MVDFWSLHYLVFMRDGVSSWKYNLKEVRKRLVGKEGPE